MNNYTETNFPYSYKKAVELTKILGNIVKSEIKEKEIGYLALHIERIIQSILDDEED